MSPKSHCGHTSSDQFTRARNSPILTPLQNCSGGASCWSVGRTDRHRGSPWAEIFCRSERCHSLLAAAHGRGLRACADGGVASQETRRPALVFGGRHSECGSWPRRPPMSHWGALGCLRARAALLKVEEPLAATREKSLVLPVSSNAQPQHGAAPRGSRGARPGKAQGPRRAPRSETTSGWSG